MYTKADYAILDALQSDASLSNAALSERVHLSASQCSRRRQALEEQGVISGYHARLDAARLGFAIEALTRVSLSVHSESASEDFAAFIAELDEIAEAFAITGDADYLLRIRARTLDELADFIHRRLLPHAHVSNVKSDIVLRRIKRDGGLQLA